MNNTAYVTMELTPEMEKTFKDAPFFLEIEMLQGFKGKSENGLSLYDITITDETKIEVMREFVLKVYSRSHQACMQ